MKNFAKIMGLFLLVASAKTYAQDVPLNYDVENTGASCSATPGPLVYHEDLTDPFEFTNGGRVSTFEDWKCRRNEIKTDIEEYEIGYRPVKPSDITASYSGGTLTVTVRENGKTLTLTSNFSLPSGSGPHPIVIGMNSGTGTLSSGLFSGVVQVPFMHNQVTTYNSKSNNDPFYQMYPNLTANGQYCAWSWGVSRIIDGLEIVADQLNLDMSRIAVSGCSYAGKMALFSGAFDERITLTIAQESGGGGINSWRMSDVFVRRDGEDVEKINNTSSVWFKSSMRSLNPYELPHDHHELIAMIAPRAFLALGNPPYGWMCDESGYKSCMAALEVWKAMGVEDRFGFDFASDHGHCQATTSQNNAVTAFVNKFLKGNQSANTNIKAKPVRSVYVVDDYADYYDWEPLEQVTSNPNIPRIAFTSPSASTLLVDEEVTFEISIEDINDDVTSIEYFLNDEKIGNLSTAPYQYTTSFDQKGSYKVSFVVTDAEGNSSTTSKTVSVRVPQAPYGGTAHPIPGLIELEHYDIGSNGYAYNDASPGSSTDVDFRLDEDVDIEICTDINGGYNIGYATAGEWLEYTVNVESTGLYDVEFRVAASGDDRTVSLSMDGMAITSDVAVPNTEGWQAWETVTVEDVRLTDGEHVLRLTMGETDYINMNHLTFRLTQEFVQEPFGGTAAVIPGRIEAENYDEGGEGLGFHEVNANGNEGGADYRNDEVDIENSNDDGGGYNIGYALPGEWLEYTVDVSANGSYDLDLRLAKDGANGVMHILIDGIDVTGDIDVPNTGAWQAYETVTIEDIDLTAGEHVIRVVFDTQYTNFNWMEFRGVVTNLNSALNSEISIYPNPTTASVSWQTAKEWEFLNSLGESLSAGFGKSISLSTFSSGLYFVRIENRVYKIIKN